MTLRVSFTICMVKLKQRYNVGQVEWFTMSCLNNTFSYNSNIFQ